MAHRLGSRSTSRYEHFLSPLKGHSGIFILILYDSNGSYGNMLDPSKLPPRSDGLSCRPWILKGLNGTLLETPPGAQIIERYKDFLGIRHKPRYVLVVGTPYRFYGIEDSTVAGTPGAGTVLDSFQPR